MSHDATRVYTQVTCIHRLLSSFVVFCRRPLSPIVYTCQAAQPFQSLFRVCDAATLQICRARLPYACGPALMGNAVGCRWLDRSTPEEMPQHKTRKQISMVPAMGRNSTGVRGGRGGPPGVSVGAGHVYPAVTALGRP